MSTPMKDAKKIPPILRSFMHVALLRRLAMARDPEEERKLVDDFLGIKTSDQAKDFIHRCRLEARIDDLIERRARKGGRSGAKK